MKRPDRIMMLALLFLSHLSLQAQPYKLWATYYDDGAMLPTLGTEASSVAYDPAGFVYIAGFVFDSTINIATPNSFKTHMSGGSDGYLAKFDTLSNRIWSTYIGNEEGDFQPKITLDQNGNIFVTNQTQGQQNLISTPGSYQPDIPPNLSSYSYLIKFNPDGQRLWGTYLNFFDNTRYKPLALTTDGQGNIIIAGHAVGSRPFPSAGTHQPTPLDQSNGFVLKLDPNGQFIWGTYYGGSLEDDINAVSCDASGAIYITGLTQSTSGIATPGVSYPVFNGTIYSAESYVAKLTANGQRVWSTYTNGIIATGGIASNGSGCYLGGTTIQDTGIATPGTYLQQYSDSVDYCLTRWDDNGQKIWGTYYGGTGLEFRYGVDGSGGAAIGSQARIHNMSLDATGNILIVGGTFSLDNIKVGCTYSGWREGAPQGNGFMAKFYPDGNIMWGSYFDIPPMGVACASSGSSFYMVTQADLDSLATPGAFQETKTPGTYAGYLVKMQGDYICPTLEMDIENEDDVLSIDATYHSYQWYLNDTPISGANTFQHQAVDSGTYYVTFRDACDCIYTSDTIWVAGGTGIKGVYRNDLQVILYPNPNKGVFTLSGTLLQGNRQVHYTLSDVLGKVIITGDFKVDAASFRQDMQFSQVQSGIYWLRLSTDTGESILKLVVQ